MASTLSGHKGGFMRTTNDIPDRAFLSTTRLGFCLLIRRLGRSSWADPPTTARRHARPDSLAGVLSCATKCSVHSVPKDVRNVAPQAWARQLSSREGAYR